MGVSTLTTMSVLILASLDGHRLFAAATTQLNFTTTEEPRVNRTSKELQENSKMALHDPTTVLKTTGRKWTDDDFNTFSSLTSDVIVESSSPTTSQKSYPSLTTSVPTFVTRGRYIRNPFYFSKDDQEVEFEDEQHGDLMMGGMPRWNRYVCDFTRSVLRFWRYLIFILWKN